MYIPLAMRPQSVLSEGACNRLVECSSPDCHNKFPLKNGVLWTTLSVKEKGDTAEIVYKRFAFCNYKCLLAALGEGGHG